MCEKVNSMLNEYYMHNILITNSTKLFKWLEKTRDKPKCSRRDKCLLSTTSISAAASALIFSRLSFDPSALRICCRQQRSLVSSQLRANVPPNGTVGGNAPAAALRGCSNSFPVREETPRAAFLSSSLKAEIQLE